MKTIALTEEILPRATQLRIRVVVSWSRPQSSALIMSFPDREAVLFAKGASAGPVDGTCSLLPSKDRSFRIDLDSKYC